MATRVDWTKFLEKTFVQSTAVIVVAVACFAFAPTRFTAQDMITLISIGLGVRAVKAGVENVATIKRAPAAPPPPTGIGAP